MTILGLLPLFLMNLASGMAQSDTLPAGITIDTVAGGRIPSGLPAQNVLLENLGGIAWDPAGNLVFCDPRDVIRRVRTDGTVDTIAGTGVTGFGGDGGPATSALLNQPKISRYDSAGNLYFFDSQNYRVRRVDSHGIITSVAGNGIPFAAGEDLTGAAPALSLATVADLTIDGAGNLYLDEPGLNAIRRVTPAGNLEIFAGMGTPTCAGCSNGDGGPATAATLNLPDGVVADAAGNIYILDGAQTGSQLGLSIRRVSPNGIVSTFLKATVIVNEGVTIYDLPGDLTADPEGNLYAVYDSAIVRLNPDGTTTAIAGGIRYVLSSSPDGPALPSSISPTGLTADSQGNVAFLDGSAGGNPAEIREVTAQSMLKTLAGGAPQSAPDGTALRDAWFLNPWSLAFDHNGNLYIAESQTCLIRKIDTNGVLSTFAGTGKCAYPAPAGTAKGDIAPVGSLAIDSQNRVWVADLYLNLYRINLDGTITFYATRTPVSGFTGQIAIDNKDRLYVLGLNSLYRILADGTTLQAVVLPPESGGTGHPSDLLGLGVDPAGNMYFGSNDSVYRVNDDATFAPVYTGTGYYSGGIGGGSVGHGFAVDAAGAVWAGNCFIKATASGCLGVAGGFAGDGGLAQEARIGAGQSLFAPNGNLYMLAGDRVRELIGVGAATAAPTIDAGGIVNAFSYTGGAAAPGEVISIFGSNFGSSGANAAVNNAIPATLGRTKVVIYGSLAIPILAMTANQINALLPGNLASAGSVPLAVQVDGALSATVTVQLAAAAPALATANSSGMGQGAILNQDASINSATNPALRGSVISLFGTGSGAATPQIATGALMLTTPYPAPQNNVTVTIGGQPAQILYAGAAPTLPNGVFQINVRVPANIAAGDAAAIVTVGGISTSQVVTVPVR